MSAVAHYLESAGVPTTGISLIREQTEAMRVPRFLWVPFELGRPFGAPRQPEFQRRVLASALALFEHPDGFPVLEDFPDDAPIAQPDVVGADEVWACPVSYRTSSAAGADHSAVGGAGADEAGAQPQTALISEIGAELATLAPWFDRAMGVSDRPAPPTTSGFTPAEAVDFLHLVLIDGDREPGSGGSAVGGSAVGGAGVDVAERLAGRPLALVVRLACDDLRTRYLVAAGQQPGRKTGADVNHWFWTETAVAHLIGLVASALRGHSDPTVRGLARGAMVPRRYHPFLLS